MFASEKTKRLAREASTIASMHKALTGLVLWSYIQKGEFRLMKVLTFNPQHPQEPEVSGVLVNAKSAELQTS